MDWIKLQSLVMWERIKRGASACQYYIAAPAPEATSRTRARRQWGHSAPSLTSAPLPNARPLDQRVVSAQWANGEDCTAELRRFIGERGNNMARRPDVFHNTVEAFAPTGQVPPLRVTYKHGMRTYMVAYRDDIVFPPSVRSPKSVSLPACDCATAIHNEDERDVTPMVKQFAGPCHDFYVGASYATRPLDLGLEGVVQLEWADGTTLALEADNTEHLCDHWPTF